MVETSILAMFGKSSSKYSVSQKSFSKLTSIFPRKTQDNFKINIQKITLIRKSWAPLFSNQKKILVSDNNEKRIMDLNHKTLTLNQ